MKNFKYFIGLSFWALPIVSLADGSAVAKAEALKFVVLLNTIIIYPTIALLSGIAILVFIWGCFEYFLNANNESARGQGAKHITFGIIGLVVMISAYAIMLVVAGTLGLGETLNVYSGKT